MHVEKSAMRMTCPSFLCVQSFSTSTAASGAGVGATVRTSSVFQRGDLSCIEAGPDGLVNARPKWSVDGSETVVMSFYLSSHLTPLDGFSLLNKHTFFFVK